jgi:hypothetical protein
MRSGGRPHRTCLAALATGALLALVACSSSTSDSSADDPADASPTTSTGGPLAYAGYRSATYAEPAHWLCRPGLADDVCHRDLDATVVNADGSASIEAHHADDDPQVDCFYVYPTISGDPTPNSDLVPGAEEKNVTELQAGRFNELCRVFAPVYRQNTLASLFGDVSSPLTREQRAQIAYDDVLDAWKDYIANDNDGRGVILLGHSQGPGVLTRLIQQEIDPDPVLRDHLVTAYLLGTSLRVPEGGDVGGDFQNVPLCRRADETGCALAYSSFRSTAPPPANSYFGRPRSGDGVAACVNPAAPAGGPGELTPYFVSGRQPAYADPGANPPITTPYVSFPGLLSAECVERDGFSYLEVTVRGDPSDPRVDDINGDLTPEWGLHLVDAEIAMGDLVALATTQADAYLHR